MNKTDTPLSGTTDSGRMVKARSPRRRVLKSGIVCFNHRHSTLPCAVRDISESGAKVSSPHALNIPDTFELYVELDGLWAECTVVWRRSDTVGVHFTSPPKVAEPKRKQVVTVSTAPTAKPSLRRNLKPE